MMHCGERRGLCTHGHGTLPVASSPIRLIACVQVRDCVAALCGSMLSTVADTFPGNELADV